MLDFKICQQLRIFILRGQAGISQIARNIRPILKTSIVKILQVVRYDERHYPVGQAFLEHDKTSRPPIPILKRMNRLELLVKVNDIVQCLLLLGVIRLEQYQDFRLSEVPVFKIRCISLIIPSVSLSCACSII